MKNLKKIIYGAGVLSGILIATGYNALFPVSKKSILSMSKEGAVIGYRLSQPLKRDAYFIGLDSPDSPNSSDFALTQKKVLEIIKEDGKGLKENTIEWEINEGLENAVKELSKD